MRAKSVISRLAAFLALAVFLLAWQAPSARACTLWALGGQDVAGGGTLIAKNRDFTPDHPNILSVVTPETGYKALSLVSVDPKGAKSLVGGVNEKGLAVVTATVGTLRKDERVARARELGLRNASRAILKRCASVAELEADAALLGSLSPVFALVADASQVAVLESSGGSWRIWKVPPGNPAAHTNHPLSTDFPEIRSREDSQGSVVRLERVRELLAGLPRPVGFEAFTALSNDSNAGPDFSLMRTGSGEKKPRTLATIAFRLPPGGKAPEVFARLTNPGEPATQMTFLLDEAFWRAAPAPGRTRQLLP